MIKVGRGSCPCSVTAPHGYHPRSRARRRWRPRGGPQHSALSCTGNQFIKVREMAVTCTKSLQSRARARARTTFPRPTARGPPARSQRRATGLLLPAPRPPRVLPARPSLFYRRTHKLAPHARSSCTLRPNGIGKSGAWCSRAPSARHTGTPVEPELAVACVLAGGPVRGGGAPSVMTRAANDRHSGVVE